MPHANASSSWLDFSFFRFDRCRISSWTRVIFRCSAPRRSSLICTEYRACPTSSCISTMTQCLEATYVYEPPEACTLYLAPSGWRRCEYDQSYVDARTLLIFLAVSIKLPFCVELGSIAAVERPIRKLASNDVHTCWVWTWTFSFGSVFYNARKAGRLSVVVRCCAGSTQTEGKKACRSWVDFPHSTICRSTPERMVSPLYTDVAQRRSPFRALSTPVQYWCAHALFCQTLVGR